MDIIIVGSSFGATVCTPCYEAHQKCSRGVPTCTRCFKKGIECTREKIYTSNQVKLTKAEQKFYLKQPATWDQILYIANMPLMTQFFFRRYVMPMVLLLPKPAIAAGLINLKEKAMSPFSNPCKTGIIPTYNCKHIMDTFTIAIGVFFRLHNPFYPLFSEEAFYSKPRSLTLIKIVIQIGLERMPQSVLTTAAKKENNLTPADFKNLPNSLDTLQCFILTMISVWLPSLEKIRIKTWLHIDKLISLLGLHINSPSSPLWLERKLAKHLVTLGPYQAGLGQSCRFTNVCWLYTSNNHLSPGFLQRIEFPFPSDRIHYITSQGIYHSFTIIAKVNRVHALSLSRKDPAFSFFQELQHYMKRLQENFVWAWTHLSQCQGNKQLLVQSRMILALRYHNDCIEMGKLALHFPLNLKEPLTPPSLKLISCFSQDGINVAMRNIRLVSTINPQAFNPDYIRILIPSIAFIMIHCKPMKAQYGHTQLLYKALLQAKTCLTRGKIIPNLKASATAYLELFVFLQDYHKILL